MPEFASRQHEKNRPSRESRQLRSEGKEPSLQNEAQVSQESPLQRLVSESPVVQKADQFHQLANGTDKASAPAKGNLPSQLKSGVEALSGQDMSDVRVHYNSDKPAQLQALATAQGNQIDLGPGQERHLPHEAWHIAQQKQGRVKATTQMKGTAINDEPALEKEADVMGRKAVSTGFTLEAGSFGKRNASGVHVSQLKLAPVAQLQGKGEKLKETGKKGLTGMDVVAAALGEGHAVGEPLGGIPGVVSGIGDMMEGEKSVKGVANVVSGGAGALDALPKAATAISTVGGYMAPYVPEVVGNMAGKGLSMASSVASGAYSMVSGLPGAGMMGEAAASVGGVFSNIASKLPALQTIGNTAKAVSGVAEAWEKSPVSTEAQALLGKANKESTRQAAQLIYNESWYQWAYAYAKSGAGIADIAALYFGGSWAYGGQLATKVLESGLIGWLINQTAGRFGITHDEGKESREKKICDLIPGLVTGPGMARVREELVPMYKLAKKLEMQSVADTLKAEFEKHKKVGANANPRYAAFQQGIA